jgi:hypothetical protein
VAVPKLTFTSRPRHFFTGTCSWLLIATLPFTVSKIQGQDKAQAVNQSQISHTAQQLRNLLPARLGEIWQATGPARIWNVEQFSALPDADVYSEYGLQKIVSRVYTNGKAKSTVEIFDMSFVSGAYGLFTFNRVFLQPNRHEFYVGRYLVSIVTDSDGNTIDQSLFDAVKPTLIGEAGQFPFLPSHLPEQDKIAESEKYIVGPAALAKLTGFSDLRNLVGFDGGVEAIMADYRNGDGKMSLIIIEYHTPQSASDGYARIESYYNSLPQPEKEKRLLKRVGNYVVEAANIRDQISAQNIIGQIKYEAKVYWAGRKLSDIPLEFRPPDPVALEEAKRTVQVLLRSFYWIGAMLLSAILLGVIAGSSLFYWNRYRRRKLGLDNLFSDAGGSLRLNLDDYLLAPEEESIKQIGKGDGHS